jgi:hypothetical protein
MFAARALRIRAECPTNIRPLVPMDAEPVEIVDHRIGKFRLRTLRIEILIAQDQNSTSVVRPRAGGPERSGVPGVQ